MSASPIPAETKGASMNDKEYSSDNGAHEAVEHGEVSAELEAKYGKTKRGLTNRHVQLMAIGGAIGTGLFVGIGSRLSNAGAVSVLLAYMFYGCLFIWPCNMCVGEMATYLPIRGSVFEFASRYVDPAFGFAMGWTYFYGSVMLFCAELSAVATVMQYWDSETNPAAWIAMALAVCLALNLVAVKWYGESEFVMASTKILLLIGLVLLTFITMCGGNPHHDAYGFRHWKHGNAFHEYYTTGDTGRFLGWWSVMLYAAFSVAGPDLMSLAAGEIQNPRRNIPRIAKLTFYRIVGFYVVGVGAVGILCNSRSTRLLGAIEAGSAGAAASPWVIGIQELGITGLPSLINACILLSGWSCGNAYLYASSRTLYSLALDRQAPRIFLRCTKSGIPIYAVLTCGLIGCVSFLVASNSAATVFGWFVDLTTCGLLIVYISMVCVWIAWARALKAQGISRDSLPWKAPLMPYAAYVALVVGLTVLIFIGFDIFSPFSAQGFVTSYFGIAFWLVMYLSYKLVKRSKAVSPANADLFSGKAEVDEECRIWEEVDEKEVKAGQNFLQRLWSGCW